MATWDRHELCTRSSRPGPDLILVGPHGAPKRKRPPTRASTRAIATSAALDEGGERLKPAALQYPTGAPPASRHPWASRHPDGAWGGSAKRPGKLPGCFSTFIPPCLPVGAGREGPGGREEGKTCVRVCAWRLRFAARTRPPCSPLPTTTHSALQCSHHWPPRVSEGGGRAWPCLHGAVCAQNGPARPCPPPLRTPEATGCILGACLLLLLRWRVEWSAQCAATPSCISLKFCLSARPATRIQAFPTMSTQHPTMQPQTAVAGSPWHGRQRAGRSRHSPSWSMPEEWPAVPCSPRPAAPLRAGKALGASWGLPIVGRGRGRDWGGW